ncbi:GNAT family N-acetyltransferase [Streptomyces sp. NPDC047108]|uniref:GNAT family N-acetyltransferase n=1 Tax=Streptomyces sp. NPDC047108 TaxID=3155025 RepID=UPI0033D084C4
MGLEVRTVSGDELRDWMRAMATGFLQAPEISAEEVEMRRPGIDPDRTQGAFDAGRCVGTYRSFAQRLTVAGGGTVAANAVSNVTVSPTHRRRGLLSRMMETDQAQAKERGDVLSTLVAAEYPIYGRYGFGPATWTTAWEVDVARSGVDPRWSGPGDGGRVDLTDGAEVRKLGPQLHERLRAVQHGAVDRDERWWRRATGELRIAADEWTEPFYAVHRPADGDGRIDGLLVYTARNRWEAKRPHCGAKVRSLIAATPEAERALWHFLISVDWITAVHSGLRAPDDLLPLLLPDPRAATVTTHADFLWVRLLDVPRAMEARTYPTAGSLVLDVRDTAGLAGGRFRLDASPEGASCTPTAETADLTLPVGELGALYLGDESAVRLASLGRVTEERAGAAALADTLLRTSRRPWCPDVF